MTSDDQKRLKGKDVSSSSPDYFRQDRREELKREVEKGKQEEKLQRLKVQAEAQRKLQEEAAKSRPVKERKQEVAEAKEKHEDAGAFLEKVTKREKERQEAKKQSSPEDESQGPV